MKRFELIETDHYPTFDLKITLKPCFRCNQNCWFCNEYDNTSSMWTKDDCDLVIDKLKSVPEEKKKIFFYFYGGEPTLSQHWEYLQCRLLEIFHDRDLFIQTQTNLSIDRERLKRFLENVKGAPIDICSSYHIGKQRVGDFLDKMDICHEYNALGLCFFSTEILKEDQFIQEFYKLARAHPTKVKLRFTEISDLPDKNISVYNKLMEDPYLLGNDKGKSIEFRYFMKKYPEFRQYFEEGFNFDVDGRVMNFSEVSAENVHMKFKHMKCECGPKNAVIDHNLKVYHCNDDFYNNIKMTNLQDVCFGTYFERNAICLNSACYDGLEFTKIKV